MKLSLIVCFVGLLPAFGSDAYSYDEDKLTALEEQLATQNKQLTAHNKQLTIVMKLLQLQNEQLAAQNKQLWLQDEEIEAIKKTAMPRHEVEENQIAFSVASHDHFGPVTVETNIPYPVVYTNVGGAWNPGTNAFQVTKAGFYLFTASFRGEAGDSTWASIAHTTTSGSKRIATISSPGTLWAGDANAAIFHVDVGDFVSVQLRGGSGVIGGSSAGVYSTFSGLFLFP